MDITRRFLLRGIATLAAAVATRAVAPPVMAAPAPVAPSMLDFLTAELQWAHEGLIAAVEAERFGAWVVDSDEEKPNRSRLARALMLSRDLDPSDPLAATVSSELELLWAALTRPSPWTLNDVADIYGGVQKS